MGEVKASPSFLIIRQFIEGNNMNGAEIREARLRLSITQAELGEALSVAGNTVARWERGELLPPAPKMLRLAIEMLLLQKTGRETLQPALESLKAATSAAKEL